MMKRLEKHGRTQRVTLKNGLISDYCRFAIYLHDMNFLMLTARHRLSPLLRLNLHVCKQSRQIWLKQIYYLSPLR